MKKQLLILILSFICLTAVTQTVTLSIQQDYLVPDIPLITQIGDTLLSSIPIGNQWYKDGVELPGETSQRLEIRSSGHYKVGVTLGSGCSRESKTFIGIKSDVPIIQTIDFTCTVFPNPNIGRFFLELISDKAVVFDFELFTSNGESVVKQSVNHPSGKMQIPIGKTSLSAGIYFLQIKHGIKIISRQIIVN